MSSSSQRWRHDATNDAIHAMRALADLEFRFPEIRAYKGLVEDLNDIQSFLLAVVTALSSRERPARLSAISRDQLDLRVMAEVGEADPTTRPLPF